MQKSEAEKRFCEKVRIVSDKSITDPEIRVPAMVEVYLLPAIMGTQTLSRCLSKISHHLKTVEKNYPDFYKEFVIPNPKTKLSPFMRLRDSIIPPLEFAEMLGIKSFRVR